MSETNTPPSFDNMAVALAIAASKLRLDLEQMEFLAARIELSTMGTSIACSELQRNLDLIVAAHYFFKDNAAAEPEVRAMVLRKKNGRWGLFARAAVV
jgi:hypothetical protein